jgi:hypothetical protein
MPAANLVPITGADGYVAMINSTSVPVTAETLSNITTMPGGNLVYPAKQIYQVTARAHKVMDPRATPVVYVGGVSQSPTLYRIFWGAGIIFFFAPRAEATPAVTMDYSYMPTASATDVVGVLHVNNWQLNMSANQIEGDEYGTIIAPSYRGKLGGTWQFDALGASSKIDLFNLMLTQSFFTFALYETISGNRLWVVYGDLTSNPINAPSQGMVAGTINGGMRYTPTFLNEAL